MSAQPEFIEKLRRKVDDSQEFDPGDEPDHEPARGSSIVIKAGDQFLRELSIPAPLIDGLVPRGQLYALTAPTGHGKTAIATLMQLCIANGPPFAGREVERGRVLVLAGENPDDYALRLLATAQAMRMRPDDARGIGVVAGSFGIGAAHDELMRAVRGFGEVIAVFVDTSAAFFGGDDENANVAMRVHASHLRALCSLPGKPAVIALCHPIKNAQKDNLVPRGGGAFLAEVDGNLTAWRDDKLVSMHWAGKIRGPGFEPISFELLPQELAIQDTKGRPVYSVAALPANGDRAEVLEQAAQSDENRVLVAMQRKPGASVAGLATAAGMTDGACRPQKSKVHRLLASLAGQGLVRRTRAGSWALTAKGQKEADEVPA